MEVIAEALEDPAVLAAITANRGGIYFSLVTSADTARMSVPCRRTVSKADAPAAASLVRVVPRSPGNSTGLGGMETASVVPAVPAQADRVVFDMTAHGLGDFARALRQKFVSEIGGLPIAPDSPTYASR